jgi:uncharacterized membrane protein YdfJ with MMPL/SSD domain
MLFHVGVLAITGMAVALLADYTLTPLLMFVLKPLGKEKHNPEAQRAEQKPAVLVSGVVQSETTNKV